MSEPVVDIHTLQQDNHNFNKGTTAGKQLMEKSFRELGAGRSILLDKDGRIIAGNKSQLAAIEAGITKVRVIETTGDELVAVKRTDVSLDDKKGRELALADNQTTKINLDWDDVELASVAEEVGIDLQDWALTKDDIETPPISVTEDEPVEEYKESICKEGDIWQLGNHRLLCGSSTSADDVKRLMDGCHADLLFTSPPYSDMRTYNGGKDLDPDNLANFIRIYEPYVDYQAVNLGLQMKEQEIFPYWNMYIDVAHNSGLKLLAWCIWDKLNSTSVGSAMQMIPLRHEWIFVFGEKPKSINRTWKKKEESIKDKKGSTVRRQQDGTTKRSTEGDMSHKYKKMETVCEHEFLFSTITKQNPESGDIRHEHPATFPVALPSEYIQAFTDKGGYVVEPFCGSGTTLIACEQLGRRCFAMELDPHYCDVIIARWEKLTGNKATKL